jgi:hypothetical protein
MLNAISSEKISEAKMAANHQLPTVLYQLLINPILLILLIPKSAVPLCPLLSFILPCPLFVIPHLISTFQPHPVNPMHPKSAVLLCSVRNPSLCAPLCLRVSMVQNPCALGAFAFLRPLGQRSTLNGPPSPC